MLCCLLFNLLLHDMSSNGESYSYCLTATRTFKGVEGLGDALLATSKGNISGALLWQ